MEPKDRYALGVLMANQPHKARCVFLLSEALEGHLNHNRATTRALHLRTCAVIATGTALVMSALPLSWWTTLCVLHLGALAVFLEWWATKNLKRAEDAISERQLEFVQNLAEANESFESALESVKAQLEFDEGKKPNFHSEH